MFTIIYGKARIVEPVATNEMTFEFLTTSVISWENKSVVEDVPFHTFSNTLPFTIMFPSPF